MFGPPQMHEIFCPLRNGSAGLPPVAQILNKAGIANRQSPEFCQDMSVSRKNISIFRNNGTGNLLLAPGRSIQRLVE